MGKTELSAWVVNLTMISVLNLPKILPYHWRIPFVGWITSRIIAPLAGYEKRACANLAMVCPELTHKEVTRISREASSNAGRVMAEMFSRKAFFQRHKDLQLSGPGVAALEEARLAKRPIIVVSGHFGNYDVGRVILSRQGHEMGVLYRPMRNAYFNAHYVRKIEAIAKPSFQQNRRGLAEMIRHLKAGKMIALLSDQRDPNGTKLSFFGHPVLTPLSAAQMALKYDALLIPMYGLRHENGLDFDAIAESPIPHSDAETMMQQVNDSLEAQVRAHMGQWLWVHRRWGVTGK